jgi:hypothetical protein
MVNADVPFPLQYVSADPAALRPGETLLWEGGATRQRRWWHRRPLPAAFRVTDRRAFYALGRPRPERHQGSVALPIRDGIIAFQPRRGQPAVWLGGPLWLTGLDDWQTVAAIACSIPRVRPPRPSRRRRPLPPPEARMADAVDLKVDALDLGLLADERVLWHGRPSPRDALSWPAVRRGLGIVAWACLPTAVLSWAVYAGFRETAAVIFGLLSVLWLVAAGYQLTIAPLRRRWRLDRSRYVLTHRRAIAIAPLAGGRRVTFVFLDALPPTFSRQLWPDGFGDLFVTPSLSFERIADPLAVHTLLVDAVLTARRELPDLGWTGTEPVESAE